MRLGPSSVTVERKDFLGSGGRARGTKGFERAAEPRGRGGGEKGDRGRRHGVLLGLEPPEHGLHNEDDRRAVDDLWTGTRLRP